MNDLLPGIPEQLNRILNDIGVFLPEIYLTGVFIVVLLADLLVGRQSSKYCRAIALAGLVIVAFKSYDQLTLLSNGQQLLPLFNDMLVLHSKSVYFKLTIDVLCMVLLVWLPWDKKLATHAKGLSDMYTIIIASVLGMHLMVMASNLLTVFLSVEMVSIASYLLVAYRAESNKGAEAGLKYVLFGAAASAIMLYGISLLYGFAGTLNIFDPQFPAALAAVKGAGVNMAIGLVLLGIGFKLSFVPVHFWVPDVYEGASTPVTAYLSTLPKVAGFALLANFVNAMIWVVPHPSFDFRTLFAVVGTVTMIVGNFAAISQQNVKRMLAYSSVGHTGFALMAVTTFSKQGLDALAYYLLVYGIANMAALLLAANFENEKNAQNASEYKGLGIKYPVASVNFVIVLISLTGLPVTAGFTGKLFVFSAVYSVFDQSKQIWLLILLITGAIVTVVSLFYYIKIPLNLFLKRVNATHEVIYSDKKVIILSSLLALLLILLGIFPNWLY